jgi:hypothetical protein
MKVQWQWPGALVFGVVFVTLGLLVWQQRIPADLLGILIAWLVPSPMSHRALEPKLPDAPGAPTEH